MLTLPIKIPALFFLSGVMQALIVTLTELLAAHILKALMHGILTN